MLIWAGDDLRFIRNSAGAGMASGTPEIVLQIERQAHRTLNIIPHDENGNGRCPTQALKSPLLKMNLRINFFWILGSSLTF